MRRVRRRGDPARQKHGVEVAPLAEPSNAVLVRTGADLQRLSASIANPNRRFPVVVFAQHDGALSRFLSPADIATLADIRAEVYVVAGQDMIDRLKVPPSVRFVPLTVRQVSGWVWWHYAAHPAILARAPENSQLSELRDQLDRGRPAARTQILQLGQVVAQLETAFAENLASCAQESLRADVSESSLLTAWELLDSTDKERGGAVGIAEMDREDQLHALIFRAWLRLDKASRACRPLSYVFLSGFVATTESHPQLALERLAPTCALIACGQSPMAARASPVIDIRSRSQLLDPAVARESRAQHDGQIGRVALGPIGSGAAIPHVYFQRREGRPVEFSRVSMEAA